MRELVAEDEAHLPGREAAVQHRVPDEDAATGPDSDGEGVRSRRLIVDLLDADGRVPGVLTRLEPADGRGQPRRADRMRSDPHRVRSRELLHRAEREQDHCCGNPPVPGEPLREQEHDRQDDDRRHGAAQ